MTYAPTALAKQQLVHRDVTPPYLIKRTGTGEWEESIRERGPEYFPRSPILILSSDSRFSREVLFHVSMNDFEVLSSREILHSAENAEATVYCSRIWKLSRRLSSVENSILVKQLFLLKIIEVIIIIYV